MTGNKQEERYCERAKNSFRVAETYVTCDSFFRYECVIYGGKCELLPKRPKGLPRCIKGRRLTPDNSLGSLENII